MFTPRREGHAKLHTYYSTLIEEGPEWNVDDTYSEEYRTTVMDRLDRSDLVAGDVIVMEGDHYRNEYRFMYDGDKVCNLCSHVDGYGSIKGIFNYPTFPADYWSGLIDHNRIIWLDVALLVMDPERFTPYRCELEDEDGYLYRYDGQISVFIPTGTTGLAANYLHDMVREVSRYNAIPVEYHLEEGIYYARF